MSRGPLLELLLAESNWRLELSREGEKLEEMSMRWIDCTGATVA